MQQLVSDPEHSHFSKMTLLKLGAAGLNHDKQLLTIMVAARKNSNRPRVSELAYKLLKNGGLKLRVKPERRVKWKQCVNLHDRSVVF